MADCPRIVQLVEEGSDELRRHVVALASGLKARRVEAHVVGPLSRQFRDELSHQGIRWVNLPFPSGLSPRSLAPATQTVIRFLRNTKPVMVHGHGLAAGTTAALALTGLTSTSAAPPLVFTPHVVPRDSGAFRERRARRNALGRTLDASRAVIASTQSEREQIIRFAGKRKDALDARLYVVPPGVERRRQSSLFDVGEKRYSVGLHRDTSIVVTAAPLDGSAPVADFLETAAVVSALVPSVEFAVLGGGPELEGLQALAHELGLFGSTVFLPWRPDTLDIISTCNVYVALTDDAAGIAYTLEALARDLRVVGRDLPAIREVFGQALSLPLVPLDDRQAFADAILQQLEGMSGDEDERVRTAEGFAWGMDEVLASQDEYDLDRPGLDPRDRRAQEESDIERLLSRYSVANMVEGVVEVYNRVLSDAPCAI
ncbi:MAG: glycosyltransferase [Armatimonadetes bacterium]|nr:glycosyltransferase [Armatimonadota bacterium]